MFYFVVGALVVGYCIFCGLQKIAIKPLKISCPCLFVGMSAISVLLYYTNHKFLAFLAFGIGIYLLVIALMAIRKISIEKIEPLNSPAK